eukprot:CAMPEP_0206445178 /NCGR_PEP_ID=MMETSP0324_2-20121206/15348_1 /ASSEMBLY_ACC=CAM_ASM_000836 /TAXON_ID=2866 /ORGANISM="Crypthecodinium cohnii, Strain Seligo" /LENGTH=656 /DNA_ID=CAMNT_0053913333 /DNA_START=179 /DNA_END=2150 /DNA_ORIENTATION=+
MPATGEDAAGAPIVTMRDEWKDAKARHGLADQFKGSSPYRHIMVRPFLGKEQLKMIRGDLEKLNATEKETDLFRFFQTSDLAPREVEEPANGKKKRRKKMQAGETSAPALSALADFFASDEYRSFCQDVTGCGELTERVDLSAQIYSRGGHLLCHDDVIGTRKISFIYYLTDPEEEWTSADGGALELYPADSNAPPGTPSSLPTKEVLPLSDALVFFVVEPGVTFHAVREVRGERARVSIQGWLHAPSLEATSGFQNRSLATLQQLLQTRGSAPTPPSITAGVTTGGSSSSSCPAQVDNEGELTEEDRTFLKQWLATEYVSEGPLSSVAERFAGDSYALLSDFLKPEVFAALAEEADAVDAADALRLEDPEAPVPDYATGAKDGWTVIGPPHLRRYLRFEGTAEANASPHAKLGASLAKLRKELFASSPFRKWLKAATGLEPKTEGRAEVRRFRPGMDYTVAAQADHIAEGFADLDVSLMIVSPKVAEEFSNEEVGGFESYLAADDDKNETVEAQEVYRGAEDEGPLVNIPPTPNALAIVMRDAQTLRFVKYLSRDAPASRLDVAACYPVESPEEDDDDDEEEMEGEGKMQDDAYLPPRLTLPSMTSIAFFMSLRSGVLIVNFTPPLLPSWQLESARLEFRKNEESALEERFPSDL